MKKIIIIPILILLSFLCIAIASPISVLGEDTVLSFSGTGLVDDPYIITTEEHLIELSNATKAGNSFLDKYIRLDSDIKMTKPFTPIGDGTTPFCGTFLGNNHTITNLELIADSPYVGLFGHLGETESRLSGISNLRLNYPVINIQSGFENMTENVSIGLLVGYQGNRARIVQCLVDNAKIIINSTNTSNSAPVEIYVGGLVGKSTGSIYSSTAHATIEVDYSYTGSWRPSDNTYSFRTMVGGLIGYVDYIDTATDINNSSVNTTKLTLSTGFDDANVKCEPFLGGLVGYSTESTLVNDCVFITDETADNETFWMAKSAATPQSGTLQGAVGVILGYSERVASAVYNYGCWMRDINITESDKVKPSDDYLLVGYDLQVASGYASDLTEGCIAYTSFLGTGYIVAAPGPTGAVADPLIDNLTEYVSGKPSELWSNWEENFDDGLPYLRYTWNDEHTYEMSLDGNTLHYACTTCNDAYATTIVISEEIIYNGDEQTPIKFAYEGPWPESVKLNVTYQNNINPGIATAFITDNVNTIEYNFTILCSGHTSDGNYYHDDNEHWYLCTLCNEKYDVKGHTYEFGDVNDLENIGLHCTTCLTEWNVEIILLDNVSLVYTGDPIEPYTFNYESLPDRFNVTIVYENNIECGDANVSISLTNINSLESSTRSEYYTILPKDIETEWFSTTSPVQYTGSLVYPEVTLSPGIKLEINKDYTIEYTNNQDIGTATVTVKGMGNYGGEVPLEYEIACIEHDYHYNYDDNNHWYQCSLCDEISGVEEHEYVFTNTDDENNISLSCSDCLIGWNIEIIFLDTVSLVYSGKAIEPYTLNYESLPDRFTVTTLYENNVDCGEATVTISLIDTKTQESSARIKNFKIISKEIEQEWFSITSPVQYTGTIVTPEIIVLQEMGLEINKDYTAEHTNNQDIGTATVTITGINNYSGEVQLKYEIACIEHDYHYNFDKNNHWHECSLCGDVSEVSPHDLTLAQNGDSVIATCNECDAGWFFEVRYDDEIDLEFDGTEKKAYTLFYEEYPEAIVINVTYKNNINSGEATAEFEIGDIKITKTYTITHTIHTYATDYTSDDLYHYHECLYCDEITDKGLHEGTEECSICGHSMDNYESKKDIEDQKETIDKIQSGTTDDPELNEAIKNVPEEVIQEITDKSKEQLDKISQMIDNNEISKEEANIRISIVEESTKAAVIISNTKIDEVKKLEGRDEDSPIKLKDTVENFFQRQFDELLKFDFNDENTTLEAYQNAVTFTNAVVTNMRKAVGTIHECDGEEAHTEVNSFIENMSVKTFKNFDKEAADREFVMLAYQAILRHLQQQTLEMLEESYQDAINNNQGSSLAELERIYLDNKEQITNIDTFEGIVLSVLQEKYIAIINSKYDAGLYNDVEKEQLLQEANDNEKFKVTYFEIFESWALNEQTEDISLQELTSTVVNDYGKDKVKIDINDHLTSPEIICLLAIIGSFGAVNIVYFIFKSKGGILK